MAQNETWREDGGGAQKLAAVPMRISFPPREPVLDRCQCDAVSMLALSWALSAGSGYGVPAGDSKGTPARAKKLPSEVRVLIPISPIPRSPLGLLTSVLGLRLLSFQPGLCSPPSRQLHCTDRPLLPTANQSCKLCLMQAQEGPQRRYKTWPLASRSLTREILETK
jgi:hypothetical protein